MTAALVVVTAVVAALLAGCGDDGAAPLPPAAEVGDVGRGRVAVEAFGCGACHEVPGVPGADGVVGPPLTRWSQRSFIAGALPNTQPNLVRWLLDPDAVEPGTAMPDLGLSEDEAEDVSAYLLSIE